MPQGTVTVGTTATLLVPGGASAGPVLVQNGSGGAVFFGDSSVTATGATAGPSVAASASATLPGSGTHGLYGIVASGTSSVSFLYSD